MSLPLQLFLVPPEQLDEWDEDFEEEFSLWKRRDSNSNSKKSDYRQFIINLNSENNLDEIYDNLEIGLEAFKKLGKLISKFRQYNLNDNLEKLYSDKENVHVKYFIKWGTEFVGSMDTVDLAKNCPTEPVGHLTNSDDEVAAVAAAEPVEQLADSVNKAPDVEDKNVKEEMEVTIKKTKSHRKRKEKRRERLLKYHKKLVEVKGLPPSNLMQQTPGLSPDLDNISRRNLMADFEAIQTLPRGHPALSTATSAGGCQVPMPGFSQPMVQGAGNISNTEQFSSLLSSPQTVMSWPASSVWPEARPMMGLGGNLHQPGLFNGSYSGLLTPPSLSPAPQSSFGWSVGVPSYQPQPHPVQLNGSPAYCFHCLQFGKVYNISPV